MDRSHARLAFGAALAAALAGSACRNGGSAPRYGLDRRTEVPPLPLPSGLPAPLPVAWTNAFPALTFDHPLFLTAPPDGTDRIVVVEQPGRVRVFANDPLAAASTVLLDLTAKVQYGGEEGLLGFAFHPAFASNGWFYVYYSAGGPRRSVLARFTISAGDPDAADPESEVVLLEVEQPFANHNAGALAFGPDGKLYVALGDGGSANDPLNHAQDPTTLLGSILRLNDDGSVPADNPFVGAPGGGRGEIWAYGLRNPWRMSFDRATGRLWVGDVGQGAREEIDVVERGGNYGWRVYEGNRENIAPDGLPTAAFLPPVHDYTHAQGTSVTGGYVYRGTAVPSLVGAYVYADFGSGRVWALVYDGAQAVQNLEIATVPSPASFGEDAAGELYVCCFDGVVRKLVPDPTPPPPAVLPPLLSATGLFADVATLRPAPGVLEYDVTAPLWSDGAAKRRWLALPGSARIGFAADDAFAFPVGTAIVKHFEIETAPGTTTRLETRVLLLQESGWLGFSYRWDATGSDAALVDPAGETFAFDVVDTGGASETRPWTIPSRGECLVCHTAAAGRVLGVRTRQLNRDFAFPLRTDNQLRTWNHIGLFTTDIGDPAALPAHPDPGDSSLPLADRARAYLDANCAQCHRPLGPTPVDLDLRAAAAVAAMQLFGVAATSPSPDGVGMRAVAGDRSASDLWLRMQRRDGFGMPPLGSHRIDASGSQLVGAWIDTTPP